MFNIKLINRIDTYKLPLTFMATVFTLPVLSFKRWDPSDPTKLKPDGGLLNSGYTFGLIGE